MTMVQTLNYVAMTSGTLIGQSVNGKQVYATSMHEREDFAMGIVQK